MADQALKGKILTLLASTPSGLTLNDICNQLSGANAHDTPEEIRQRTDTLNALAALKAEHRVWPTGDYWKLTSRGRGA